MAAAGINVGRDGGAPLATVLSLNATWERIVALDGLDLTGYLLDRKAAGIKVLLVLARESGGDYAGYAKRYGPLIAAVQAGNEPDGTGPSSWSMNQAEFVALGQTVRACFPGLPVVAGGLVSGHPEWLQERDLSWCDALGVHPYGRSPDPTWPHPGWGTGYMGTLLDGYSAYGKPLVISELGLSTSEVDEAFHAEYVGRCMTYLNGRTDVLATMWFCLSDRDVPLFGLYRGDGTAKPSVLTYKATALQATTVPWPGAGAPTPPMPGKPDPWQWWTAEQIASASMCPVASVRNNWPRLTEQLWHCGITDANTWLAMIGTVAIESASTCEPVREAFYMGEPEPAETYRKTLAYYPYYGRGFIQNTWQDSYRDIGPKICQLWGAGADDPTFDLVTNPDNLLDPDMSAAAAAIFFRDKAGGALATAARTGDWAHVRYYVYGGSDPSGVARITRIATTLGAGTPPVPPVPVPDPAAPYILALKTLRDETIPAIRAQVDEADRIVRQFVGNA